MTATTKTLMVNEIAVALHIALVVGSCEIAVAMSLVAYSKGWDDYIILPWSHCQSKQTTNYSPSFNRCLPYVVEFRTMRYFLCPLLCWFTRLKAPKDVACLLCNRCAIHCYCTQNVHVLSSTTEIRHIHAIQGHQSGAD